MATYYNTMKRIVLLIAIICQTVVSSAQIVEAVKWSGEVIPATAAGAVDSVRLTATIQEGWHMTLISVGEEEIGEEIYESPFTLTFAANEVVPIRYNSCNDQMCTAPEIYSYEVESRKSKDKSGLSGEAGQNTQRNTPFTADQLNGAWVGLKSTFKKEQRLVAMLDAHRPRLIDDHTALITFVNPWQEEEFKKFSRQILTILRDNLQNDTLLLQTVVAENMAPKRAYTAEEKYRVLQEQNPYLADFKKQFDMLLE